MQLGFYFVVVLCFGEGEPQNGSGDGLLVRT